MCNLLRFLPFLLLHSTIALAGYEGPSPLINIKVSVSVEVSASGIYSYKYTLENPSSNDGKIVFFNVFIPTDLSKDKALPNIGLSQCQKFQKGLSAVVANRRQFLPVGSSAPNDWKCNLSALKEYTFGSFTWTGTESAQLAPGSTLSGFALTSYGLPGITDALANPKIDYSALPETYYDNPDATIALQNRVKWEGKTIGPKAPPKVFVPSDFAQYLISLNQQALQLGWIKNSGISTSFYAKLEQVRDKLNSGDVKIAKNVLNSFLSEIEAQKSNSLTSEAYALLHFNTKYLYDQL